MLERHARVAGSARRNPKAEIRKPKEGRNPKSEKGRPSPRSGGQAVAARHCHQFVPGSYSAFGYRIAGFGFDANTGDTPPLTRTAALAYGT
jgi:hypothetical protein